MRAEPPAPAMRLLAAAAVISAAVGGTGVAFAYTAGWLSPGRLTPDRLVDALGKRGGDPVGHRRNHAKGICFTGRLEANGAGARLSAAPMLATGRYPVVGRFAIAVGNPAAPDMTGRVRSMAIRVVAPDGQEWRSGMNSSPVFAVSTPHAFYELTLATDLDPHTGRPDPSAPGRFLAAHPEAAAFATWARTAPWTASYADQDYSSLNAFIFVAADGTRHAARWSMRATVPPKPVSQADLAHLGPDFLEADLAQRLEGDELRWRLVVTLAVPSDPTDDATRAWPEDREQVEIGTLVVERTEAEAAGPCRDYNYDPLVLPVGILPSDDPLLPARSATYAASFDRRTAEGRFYSRQAGTQP
jgi:catalase